MSPCLFAPAAAGAFSPLRESLGLDARELTPGLVRRITYAGAEARSFKRAAIVMKQVACLEPILGLDARRLAGEVDQVLNEFRVLQTKLGDPPSEVAENDLRKILAKTIHYLENNRERMKYPEYRQDGLPVTTAWMESLVKEMNYRVKGTEMFWNDPDGAEAILQVRAAALCDDERLEKHLTERPGCPFTRRPQPPRLTREKIKS
jgi:hypothetical protein